jgi:hypothetical protein
MYFPSKGRTTAPAMVYRRLRQHDRLRMAARGQQRHELEAVPADCYRSGEHGAFANLFQMNQQANGVAFLDDVYLKEIGFAGN